jgi:hypothetical protein
MGPFDPPNMTGGKYALTIRDTSTLYSEVKILKAKSDATSAIIQTINCWETQTGRILKILRSDNGGDFKSKILANYLVEKGTIAERSLPYHHFQNGAEERYNRTVANMGRSVLYNSKLNKQLWGYAFMWSAWTLNCIPNKTFKSITPYKFFYGDKPQLDQTRVFGLKAYVLVAPKKQKKLNYRAVEGLVVGHLEESKGWTFWIPATKKLMSSVWANFGCNSLPLPTQPAKAKTLQLGNFRNEEAVAEQKTNIDQLATLPQLTDHGTPNTF